MEMSKSVVVTGGCGFVGLNVGKKLCSLGYQVHLVDLTEPRENLITLGITFSKADICNQKQIDDVMRQHRPDVVVHCAGFGLASTTNLPAYDDKTKQVNIDGTKIVVEACLKTSVTSIVLTSSVNVVFSGRSIINGTEDSHGWLSDYESHCDTYSKTKQDAEKIVQFATGMLNANGNPIKTCTLRLGGVYGPGDQTILGRSLKIIQHEVTSQFFVHRDGILMDYVHIDNVVQAHVKAVQLLEKSSTSINGESFFITDGFPTDMNFFLDPLYSMVTRDQTKKFPKTQITVPFVVIYAISLFFVLMSYVFGKWFKMPYWAFTPMETYKLTTSHYFSIDKARNLLNYEPKKSGDEEWSAIKRSLSHLVPKSLNRDGVRTSFYSLSHSRNFALFLLPICHSLWKRI